MGSSCSRQQQIDAIASPQHSRLKFVRNGQFVRVLLYMAGDLGFFSIAWGILILAVRHKSPNNLIHQVLFPMLST